MAARKDKTTVNRAKKGFGLAEVLVSSALFVLVWLALVGNIVIGKASEVRARHHIQAANSAQSHVEQVLRQMSYGDLLAMIPTSPNQINVTIGDENPATQFNAVQHVSVHADSPANLNIYVGVMIDMQWHESPVVGGGVLQHEYVFTVIPNDPIGN